MPVFTQLRASVVSDPRHYQIAVLTALLTYGVLALDFEIAAGRAAAIVATALLTQALCTRLWRLPRFDPRSALISGLSLCLLLRTNAIGLALAAAVIAVASKFVIQFKGKHLFNPTNIAIVATMAATGQVWASPGQWGNVAFFAFLMACLGGLVVNRAKRSDVTYAFMAFYMALVFGRSIWLGEPLSIPLHRLENGALLLFTFFMISDPRTTPNSRAGRILFAFLVASLAWYIQFRLFRTNGPLWSLAICAMSVPLIDWLLPAQRYEWKPRKHDLEAVRASHLKVQPYETIPTVSRDADNRGGMEQPGASRILRLLRGEGGHEAVQQGVAGRARPSGRSNRADDGQRFSRRPERVRRRHSRAGCAAEGTDSHR